MRPEKKLELSNSLAAVSEKIFTPIAFMALGLIPVMFIGIWCMLGFSLVARILTWAAFAYMVVTTVGFMIALILWCISDALRESWFKDTDPWRYWQVKHYGKVLDD